MENNSPEKKSKVPTLNLQVKNSNNQDGITGTQGLCTCKSHSGSPTQRLSNSPVHLEEVQRNMRSIG